MFAATYFAPRYFAPRYFPEIGSVAPVVVVAVQAGPGDSDQPKRLGYRDRKRKLRRQLAQPAPPKRIAAEIVAPVEPVPEIPRPDPVFLSDFARALAPKGIEFAPPVQDPAEIERRETEIRQFAEQIALELRQIEAERVEQERQRALEAERVRLQEEEDELVAILLLAA